MKDGGGRCRVRFRVGIRPALTRTLSSASCLAPLGFFELSRGSSAPGPKILVLILIYPTRTACGRLCLERGYEIVHVTWPMSAFHPLQPSS